MTYTYMRIYWKSDFNALKELIGKYLGNRGVQQVGYRGWEIFVHSKEIVKDIKKFCRYRSKKVIIDESEEIEELEVIKELEDEMDEIDGLEDEMDEIDGLEDEIDDEFLRKWEDFYNGIVPEDLPYEEDIMFLYQYPDSPVCDCNDEDECDCENQHIRQKMIENLVTEGRYVSNTYSSMRRQEREKMDRYY